MGGYASGVLVPLLVVCAVLAGRPRRPRGPAPLKHEPFASRSIPFPPNRRACPPWSARRRAAPDAAPPLAPTESAFTPALKALAPDSPLEPAVCGPCWVGALPAGLCAGRAQCSRREPLFVAPSHHTTRFVLALPCSPLLHISPNPAAPPFNTCARPWLQRCGFFLRGPACPPLLQAVPPGVPMPLHTLFRSSPAPPL